MAIDLNDLKKLETAPASTLAKPLRPNDRVLAIVKVKAGQSRPPYIVARSVTSSQIFTAEIFGRDLTRLEADPTIESVALCGSPRESDANEASSAADESDAAGEKMDEKS